MKPAVAFFLLLGLPGCVADPFADTSHYVQTGPRTGYYIVQPGSALFRQLDLYDAPWSDTGDRLRHGYGADALAFRFNHAGTLISPPAYLAQGLANTFYTRRLGAFVLGRSTTPDVERMFGHGYTVAKRPNGFFYYYSLPIYNAAEDFGGRR
jgi:hypothetical protein